MQWSNYRGRATPFVLQTPLYYKTNKIEGGLVWVPLLTRLKTWSLLLRINRFWLLIRSTCKPEFVGKRNAPIKVYSFGASYASIGLGGLSYNSIIRPQVPVPIHLKRTSPSQLTEYSLQQSGQTLDVTSADFQQYCSQCLHNEFATF